MNNADRALEDAESQRMAPRKPMFPTVMDDSCLSSDPEEDFKSICESCGIRVVDENAPYYDQLHEKLLEWF